MRSFFNFGTPYTSYAYNFRPIKLRVIVLKTFFTEKKGSENKMFAVIISPITEFKKT